MAASAQPPRPAIPNRRRRVRHKIQTPAYVTFATESTGTMLNLHEIVDLSEDGIAIECHTPLDAERQIDLCLDLAGCNEHIYTSGKVIWTSASGRTGLRFGELSSNATFRLREWLFVNAMTGVATAEEAKLAAAAQTPPRPGYSDTLAAVTAVQREVEALGADLAGALQLITTRTQALLHASGAALALSGATPGFMICRASAGPDAPPVGVQLQVGSGFSGDCVKSGRLLKCDDAETDSRVDRESCRALGIRSILAAPVRVGEKSIGILEAFAREPRAFAEGDSNVLQRLAETVLAAVNRAARAGNLPLPGAPAPAFKPAGGVLFASAPPEEKEEKAAEEKSTGGISLPRSYLYILIGILALISAVLGDYSRPWIQNKLKERGKPQTVLASSPEPKSAGAVSVHGLPVDKATPDVLRQLAEDGDPAAEYGLGMRYATGDGVKPDEAEAARWFTKAANQWNVAAQSKLGTACLNGRGVPQDYEQAYFWMALARASGDETSKVLAPIATAHLTREQITSTELKASRWLQDHAASGKPTAGR